MQLLELLVILDLVPLMGWIYLFAIYCVYSFLPFKYRDRRADLVIDLSIACMFELLVPLTTIFKLPVVVDQLFWSIVVFGSLLFVVIQPKISTRWKQGIFLIVYVVGSQIVVHPLSSCYTHAQRHQGCTPNSTMEMILQGVFCNQSSSPAIEHCQKVLKPHLYEKQMIRFVNGGYCHTPTQLDLIEACLVQDVWDTFDLSRACHTGLTRRAFIELQGYNIEYEECKVRPTSVECREIKGRYREYLSEKVNATCPLFRPIYHWLLDQD